jgi:hypothetical protein
MSRNDRVQAHRFKALRHRKLADEDFEARAHKRQQ